MGKIMKNGRSYSGWGGSGGTTVVANPEGTATETLNKLQVGNSIYSIPSGGGGASGPVVWVPTGSDEAPATPNRFYQVNTIQAASHAGITITAPYTFNNEYGSGDDITFNVTINLDSAITDGEDIWYGYHIIPGSSSGDQDDSNAPTISITVNSVTIDNPNVTYDGTDFDNMSTEFINGNITVTYPHSISIKYGEETYTAEYSGDTQHDDVPSDEEYVGTYQYTEDLTWYSLGIAQS